MNSRTTFLHAAIGCGGPSCNCCNGGRFANGRGSRRAFARARDARTRLARRRDARLALTDV